MNVFGTKSVFAQSPELSHMAFLTVIQSKVAPFKNVFSPSRCDHERGV